jgi:hypothetical protein
MKHLKIVLIGLFCLMLVYPVLWASESENKGLIQGEGSGTKEDPYIIPRVESAIKVDGNLEDKEWEQALKLNMPYETWPGENTPASVRTECYLAYDRSNFYIGFRAFDPEPSKLRAYYYERDNIFSDDFVAVFLDTFNDERRAYGFRSNPYGVQWDDIRIRTSVSTAVATPLAFDAIYNSKGQVYDWGYAVEMSIPFNQLRFQRGKEAQVWGFNARRVYSRNMLYLLDLMRIDRSNGCQMCQYVKIKGFAGASPGRNIELVPTLTFTRTDERSDFPEGDFEKRNQDVEPGLTARWGITPNTTFSAAVNPDFSQVEADTLQLDINEPFALYYDELRPFFYEGAEFFNTYLNAVYTRTMRDPSWGLKFTGKARGNTFGVYVVRDDITNLIFPGSYGSSSTSLDMANTSAVFRYKRDFGSNYTVGLLATNREGDDYFNRMAGIDTELRFSKKDRVQVQFLGSSTQYPYEVARDYSQEEDEFGGSAFAFNYTHDSRNWDLLFEYKNLTGGFRSDLGFITQVNYQIGSASTFYTWYGSRKNWFRELTLGGKYSYTADQDGNLLYSGGYTQLSYKGPSQTDAALYLLKYRESYLFKDFDEFSVTFVGGIKPSARVEFSLTGIVGDRIDYANVRLGNRVLLAPEIVFKPGRRLRLTLSHTYERLSADSDRVFTANASEIRGIYHLNVRAFFRAILQYIDYDYNAENYTFPINPRRKNLATQLLFSYRVNPRTLFFLGYSDTYLGNQNFPLTQRSRTFFAKLSYAWSL